jgi:hypothetical protein
MKNKPPVLLILVAVAYLGYLGWLAIAAFTPVVAVRLALSVALFFFVLRGSRVAGNILSVLSALSALLLLVAAFNTFAANVTTAVLFMVAAGLLSAFSAYLFLSPTVRTFQGKVIGAPTT